MTNAPRCARCAATIPAEADSRILKALQTCLLCGREDTARLAAASSWCSHSSSVVAMDTDDAALLNEEGEGGVLLEAHSAAPPAKSFPEKPNQLIPLPASPTLSSPTRTTPMPPRQAQMPPPPPRPPLLRQHGEIPFTIGNELLSPPLSLNTSSAGRLVLSAEAAVEGRRSTCRSFLCPECFRRWFRLLRGGDDPVSVSGRSPLPLPGLLFLSLEKETDVVASIATAVRALKSQPVSEVELTLGGPRRMNSEEAAAVCRPHGPPPAALFPLSPVECSHAGSAAAMPSPPLE
ncbi:unnamed protein product [Ectocarpus sp. 13 AM-2016]